MSKEPQEFKDKIIGMCQEKGIFLEYKQNSRQMLEMSKMTDKELDAKRNLAFQKVRTNVLLDQYGIEGIP